MCSTYEDQRYPVCPGITPVNSGFSDTSATTLIGDEDESGIKDKEKATRSKVIDSGSEEDDLEEQPASNTSELRLWKQIRSGLHLSLHPIDLYKTGCHLWHVIQDYWWLWELATMSMSFASMAAVIVVLAVEEGKALDDWTFPIQPNSLISIFITLSKSAIMTVLTGAISQSMWMQFEQRATPLMRVEEIQEAGRGPWGSIKLLAAIIKGKRFNFLAILGAIITVITLAFDPFVQQVMSFPSRTVPAKDGKAIFRSTQNLRDLDMISVQGAILGGVYRNPQITNYTCTESSCSWPTITTLGVCSSCRDLTARADVQCSTTPGPLKPTSTDADPWTFESTNCNYTVGGNITIPTYIQTMSFPETNGRKAEYSSQWTKIKILPQKGYDNYSTKNTLGELISPEVNYWFTTVLSYSTFFDSRTTPLPKITPDLLAPQIMACGLHPCGQVWSSPAVVNGTLANGGVPTSSAPLRLQFNDAGLNRFYHTPDRSDYSDVLRVANPKSVSFPGNDTFTVSRTAAKNLTELLTQMYRSTSIGGNENFGDAFPETERGMYGLTDAIFDDDVDENTNLKGDTNVPTAAVWSPTSSFARAARGLSEYVRNSNWKNYDDTDDVEEQDRNSGKAWRQETYIEVRWAFLSLPLAVLTAALALLCGAIWRSLSKGARVWKSSSLALLLHDIRYDAAPNLEADAEKAGSKAKDGDGKYNSDGLKTQDIGVARQCRFGADSVQSMNEQAEKIKARLMVDVNGLRFIVVG
ncbi:hypothetical protein PG987_005980 [Apiospora arundinis]